MTEYDAYLKWFERITAQMMKAATRYEYPLTMAKYRREQRRKHENHNQKTS